MTKMMQILVALAAVLFISGCATRLGQFTVASTYNVADLEYSTATKQRTEGETCIHILLFLPFGHSDDRLQRAVDDAIRNGQENGSDGDLLVNVRIDQSVWTMLLYGQDCVKVEGDLVKVNAS